MTDHRPDDWARIVIGWIKDAEREMDEAYQVDDPRGYTSAARRRDSLTQALMVVDPTARMRFAMADMSGAMRRFGATAALATDAIRRAQS